MSSFVRVPKKLIEVALPLTAINEEAARRKRKAPAGYPTTLHKWWAQRPVAAARAIIFAQLVNDPSWKWELEHPGEIPPNHLKASWAKSRKRLFSILKDVILWENTQDRSVFERAQIEIQKSWRETCNLNREHPLASTLFDPERLPGLHDPFSGAGSIPMEAQRLGLDVYASDLNPIAVLITKAAIEIPGNFSALPPVCADAGVGSDRLFAVENWIGASGIAEDVRRYGARIGEIAKSKMGELFPSVHVDAQLATERPDLQPLVGKSLPVVAWIWSRTVRSPNPAFRHAQVPLASTFVLSNKPGKEAFIVPEVAGDEISFHIRRGKPPVDAARGTKLPGKGAGFKCLLSGSPISGEHIKSEGQAGRLGVVLTAIVAEGPRGRVFLPPNDTHVQVANTAAPQWEPNLEVSGSTQYLGTKVYGLTKFSQLFTKRQMLVLNTLTESVLSEQLIIQNDAIRAGMADDGISLAQGGSGARAYAEAVTLYLTLALGRALHYGSAICTWLPKDSAIARTFTKQAIQMSWDFVEGNIFEKSSSGWAKCCDVVAKAIEFLPSGGSTSVVMRNAGVVENIDQHSFISTDPPYYDNVPYADLSDFFYVWLRPALKNIYPELFATLTTPKAEELVAFAHRHGSKDNAEKFFLEGMTRAMELLVARAHPGAPVSIYYAFKQSETKDTGTKSTGWETFLEAVMRAGLAITGTWPVQTEGDNRSRGLDSNALASSIVLVCRPRPREAMTISRRAFMRELNQVLPEALDEMTRGSGDDRSPVAPVDLSQAIIGPGMAVFSKYAAVLEADGSPMKVQSALRLINRFLAEDDFDADTQFCLHWFEQHGWKEGRFGDADTLARAKGTAVESVKHAGVVYSAGGVVRLLKWAEYDPGWDPRTDVRLPIWEALHQLIRVFRTDGEGGAGAVLATIASKAEGVSQLAYRLYTLCERSGWAEDARAYNELITSWSAIEAAASKVVGPKQASLFEAA
ncbi:putative DNA methylase [Methylobacterium sp. BE186]|uniref:DUF1156 domain-containing protein n=1 Tax=Methylobacterium sp. BE186 TaxID=2817715 RepID=UPI0028633207|nr:DUF1156 domain-containing protein [Methylobacterium sp. BE186]MDR7037965.1 putative DNA methylase [Methylobacterium sp. BE186]